ncbi:MAG: hydroxymethylglutaryl-CoA reductase, degradative [Candidatus Aenigmatarchaeota archaeon]|nr:MAG: hydroxymethylglutaryl-CoA reductase, degradative [Candidatus Aenigmarchaeota archaeon]
MSPIDLAQSRRSDISGFHKLSPSERLDYVRRFAGLTDEETEQLKKECALGIDIADRMIENVVGTTQLPMGIATNFLINGKDYLVPMTIEEPSVVAAASYAAKLARGAGGFTASSTDPVMIGQIQLVNVPEPEDAVKKILAKRHHLLKVANDQDPILVKYGGGAREIKAEVLDSDIIGKMIAFQIHVDCRDAMGANAVNSMAEALAPVLEDMTGGKARLRIISNLAIYRTAKSEAVWKKDAIGEDTVQGVIDAYAFAVADNFRCATHNKGVMNGVDAVVLATGNDFRAVEAGAHSFAARNGGYEPLTKYWKDDEGNLHGSIEMPVPVGIVGGATRSHPIAQISKKILRLHSARELGEVIASVGLAQNFAALRALSTEGIQRGHMELHARNVAIAAGAEGDLIDMVASKMVEAKKINGDSAKQILDELRT